jgi:glutathione S-transferase
MHCRIATFPADNGCRVPYAAVLMNRDPRHQTFRDFYPFYLAEHSNRMSRRLHFLGTSIALGLLVAAANRRSSWSSWRWCRAALRGWGISSLNATGRRRSVIRCGFMGDWRMWWDVLRGRVSLRARLHATDRKRFALRAARPVCLDHLGVPFRHRAVSVFSNFGQFRCINPVVKAPTLVCDDGTVLMDSSLILQYVEATLAGGRTLWGTDRQQLQHEVRGVALAQAACEKSAQLIYERRLRPPEAQFAPWKERVTSQLLAAYTALEQELRVRPADYAHDNRHAPIAAAIAWQFSHSMLATELPVSSYPALVQLSGWNAAPVQRYPPRTGVPGRACNHPTISHRIVWQSCVFGPERSRRCQASRRLVVG